MNTSNDRDEKMGHEDGQEWQSADFSWDSMKEGIFEKILEEDPQFFEEKRRRRLSIWLWFSTVGLLVVGIGFWQWAGHSPSNRAVPSPHSPIQQKAAPAIAQGATNPNSTSNAQPEQGEAKASEAQPTPTTNQKGQKSGQIGIASKPISKEKTTQNTGAGLGIFEQKIIEKPQAAEAPSTTADLSVAAILPENIAVLGIVPFPIVPKLPKLPNRPLSEAPAKTPPEKGQWRLAVLGGGQASFSKYSGRTEVVGLRNDHSSAYLGYHLGVDAWMPLRKNNYLILGMGRQVSEQKIDIQTQREVDYLYANTLVSVTHYVVGGRMENHYADVHGKATENNRLLKYNRFVSTQVLLGFGKTFGTKNWQFSPFVGGSAGFFSNTDGKTIANDRSILNYKAPDIYNRVQWAAFGGFELDRKLSEHVSILLRYRFDQQWNNASKEPNMKLKFAYHSISFGAAYRFLQTDK